MTPKKTAAKRPAKKAAAPVVTEETVAAGKARTIGVATDDGGRPLVDEGGRPLLRTPEDEA